ncbi:AGE family epimerase/isomerase [Hyphococcus sp.]|jgi:mannose-6-phosphate isomerase|uniref:AGE family epimerase/isomerase n=1 Tax=Hyphococcus sp. TaxID=2038636 RepID=UPI003D0D4E87
MTGLHSSLERFRTWFVSDCLPFWAEHGIDPKTGCFYEALNFDSSPSIGRPRRVRTLFRQVHTFTQASLHGWLDGAEQIAARGFDYLLANACPDEGLRGCVFHIADDGGVLDDRRDLYDQAFVLLACASRIEAGDGTRARTLADNTIAFLDRELASPHGGWQESDRKELPRRQNPHMHLFEGFMALYRVTQEERYLAYADNIYDLFSSTFYGAAHSIVREHFAEDWRPLEDDPIEPGHMLEWVWLLNAYERCGRRTPLDMRKRLYANALAFGADPGFYGLIDNVAAPVVNKIHGPKRLWPQTEYLRASLVMAKHGSKDAAANAEKLIGDLFDTFLAIEPKGLWIDEFDSSGERLARDVPASILYHLHEAVAEADARLIAETVE